MRFFPAEFIKRLFINIWKSEVRKAFPSEWMTKNASEIHI